MPLSFLAKQRTICVQVGTSWTFLYAKSCRQHNNGRLHYHASVIIVIFRNSLLDASDAGGPSIFPRQAASSLRRITILREGNIFNRMIDACHAILAYMHQNACMEVHTCTLVSACTYAWKCTSLGLLKALSQVPKALQP